MYGVRVGLATCYKYDIVKYLSLKLRTSAKEAQALQKHTCFWTRTIAFTCYTNLIVVPSAFETFRPMIKTPNLLRVTMV
jgi:hypothetical protein